MSSCLGGSFTCGCVVCLTLRRLCKALDPSGLTPGGHALGVAKLRHFSNELLGFLDQDRNRGGPGLALETPPPVPNAAPTEREQVEGASPAPAATSSKASKKKRERSESPSAKAVKKEKEHKSKKSKKEKKSREPPKSRSPPPATAEEVRQAKATSFRPREPVAESPSYYTDEDLFEEEESEEERPPLERRSPAVEPPAVGVSAKSAARPKFAPGPPPPRPEGRRWEGPVRAKKPKRQTWRPGQKTRARGVKKRVRDQEIREAGGLDNWYAAKKPTLGWPSTCC